MDDSQLGDVIDAMFEMKVEAGQFIIRQDEEVADFFYVVETGVYSALQGDDLKTVFTYENEGYFGELALLYNMPRAASIRVRYHNAVSSQTMRTSI